jgi:hypothetical protein
LVCWRLLKKRIQFLFHPNRSIQIAEERSYREQGHILIKKPATLIERNRDRKNNERGLEIAELKEEDMPMV